MPRLNLPEVEAEMVDLARKRVELIAGDTPLLTTQDGRRNLGPIQAMGRDDASRRAA